MPQGKLKIKTTLPKNTKITKGQKGKAATKRSNCPIKPKKQQRVESQRLKQVVSKTVYKAVEEEMRARASTGQKNLSKAQQAVVEHHKKASSTS